MGKEFYIWPKIFVCKNLYRLSQPSLSEECSTQLFYLNEDQTKN